MQISLPVPAHWQDFEALCRDLFAAEWGDPETKRNGRSSQPQRGVDVFGRRGGKWHGVQCKLRDQLYGARLTVAELRREAANVTSFTPALATFVLATTAPRDVKAQEAARELTEKGPFRVEVYAWEDLVDLLHKHEHVLDRHYAWDRPDEPRRRELHNYLLSVKEKLGAISLAAIHQHMDRCPTLDAVYTAMDVEQPLLVDTEQSAGRAAMAHAPATMPEDGSEGPAGAIDYVRACTEYLVERAKQAKPGQAPRERRLHAVEFLAAHERAVLLGPAGSGKSAFASFVALCLANERLGDAERGLAHLADVQTAKATEGLRADDVWPHGALIPLFIELRAFVADKESFPKDGDQPHAGHFLDHLQSKHAKVPLLPGFVPHLRQALLGPSTASAGIEQGRGVLLLLDALDETPNAPSVRDQLQRAILAFVREYPRARVLVTSRPYAYRTDASWRLPGFADATLAKLDERAVARFVHAWYASLAQSGTLGTHDAGDRPQQLLARIAKDRHLRPLAERPLLLTLLTSLHASAKLGDGGRAVVYKASVELLFDRWNEVRGGEQTDHFHTLVGLEKSVMLEVLQRVARRVHEAQGRGERDAPAAIPFQLIWDELGAGRRRAGGEPRKIDERRALEYLDQRAGLLLAEGQETFRFPHRSYQEFLAAQHLCRDDDFPGQLCRAVHTDPLLWREVLGYCVLVHAADSPNQVWSIIEELAAEDAITPNDDDYRIVIAIASAMAESGRFRPPGRGGSAERNTTGRSERCLTRVKQRLVRCLESGALAAPDRIEAGEALGRLGDPRIGHRAENFLPIAPGAEVELGRFPVTVQEFAEFVDARSYECDAYWDPTALTRMRLEGLRNLWKEPKEFDLQREHPNRPVIGVSWHEARAFCRWLGEKSKCAVRLPTKREWLTAAIPDDRAWPWRESEAPLPELANFAPNVGHPSPVGCYPRGVSEQGHLDLVGNVWEWCSSRLETDSDEVHAASDTSIDLFEPVLLGGSFRDSVESCRFSIRSPNWVMPTEQWPHLGFRVAVHVTERST